MTRGEVLQIAQEVYGEHTKWSGIQLERLLMLADKFSAAEREACAKVCDERERANLYGVKECANAIRARGN
jgi:hypothetical protein